MFSPTSADADFGLSSADWQVRGMLVSILKRARRRGLTLNMLALLFRRAVNVRMRYLSNRICRAAEGCVGCSARGASSSGL